MEAAGMAVGGDVPATFTRCRPLGKGKVLDG
jgi:hypothetical protein